MSFFSDQEKQDDEPVKKKHHIEKKENERSCGSSIFAGRNNNYDNDDDDDDDKPVLACAAADRVGLKLLQGMEKRLLRNTSSSSSSKLQDARVLSAATQKKMRAAEEYVPLSKGGFMETTTGPVVDDMGRVLPGSVMCLRCPAPATTTASGEMRFVREADLTDEERRYGRHLSSDMTQLLFEVGRVDKTAGLLEAVFLDGTRRNLKIWEVRPAGFVEVELFQQWKKDPNSRPVRTVCTAQNSAGASLPQMNKTKTVTTSDTVTATPTLWWVVPQLVVRIVEKMAGDLFGKKFVVKSVSRKDKKIRLVPCNLSSEQNELLENSMVDVVGCEALETVVPKVNEEGIIVLGKMRGELVKVVERYRDAENELTRLKVCSTITGTEFSVSPHEVCKLYISRR